MKQEPPGAYRGLEQDLQKTVVGLLMFRLVSSGIPVGALMHPANGEKRSKATAGKLKAMGVRAGYPDLMLFRRSPDDFFCGLAIELKVWPAVLRPSQEEIRAVLVSAGWCYAVCYGVDEVDSTLERYLKRGM